MKRVALLLTAVFLFITGCSIHEADQPSSSELTGDEFYATFESYSDPETKVYVDEDVKILWNADDRVSIFNKISYNQEYRFTGKEGANAGGFKKVDADEFVTGAQLSYVAAVYPYLEETEINNKGVMTVTMPAEQHYKAGSFGPGANTMVATAEDNVLLFKNLGGYLVLKFYGENVNVASVKLEGNADEVLSGAGTFKPAVGTIPSVSMSATGGESITLVCDEPVTLGSTKEEATPFWLVVPPTEFKTGFTLTVTDTDGNTFVKKTDKDLTINRNGVLRISGIEVEMENLPMDDVIQAIDLGLSVKWGSLDLGATSVGSYGKAYSWGALSPWNDSSTWNDFYPYSDYPNVLPLSKDIANITLGNNWRIPTKEEAQELIDNCTFSVTEINSVSILKVTSNITGECIYLPFYRFYNSRVLPETGDFANFWTSSIYEDYNGDAFLFEYNKSTSRQSIISHYNRYGGLPIRPIWAEGDAVSAISMSKTLVLAVGDVYELPVFFTPANVFNKGVSWSSDNETVIAIENGKLIAKAIGSANVTATSLDGGCTATCQVTVNPGPITDFSTNSYLIWRKNSSGGWDETSSNYIRKESHFGGFNASVVEMKFQLASSTESYSTIASGNVAKDNYSLLKISDTELIWRKVSEDEPDKVITINLSEAGVTRTSLITLRFDGNNQTLSINGHSYSAPFTSFSFSCLFAMYFSENDEGIWREYTGIPDGSKVYYCKGWDRQGNLAYLGYPTKAINPTTSTNQYCWYTYWAKETTYQFSNESKTLGGFNGYIQ